MAAFGAGFIFIAILIILGIALAVNTYNRLVSVSKQVDRAWANIDVVLKQRYDEIPQLIQVIEQFSQYEKRVIDQLVLARKNYGSAQSVGEKIASSGELSTTLRGIIAIGEGYPELKSNQNFLQLQSRISALEGTLADRREFYNDTVAIFNTRIAQIPEIFIASLLSYKEKELYKVSDLEKTQPDLKIKLPV